MKSSAETANYLENSKRLKRAQDSLWFLAKICLKQPFVKQFALDPKFHLPIFQDADRKTKLRAAGKYHKNEGHMWSRGYFKTTMAQIRAIQRLLRDPMTTFIWWHAVEAKAHEAGLWIGKQILENKELRVLFRQLEIETGLKILPHHASKKFVTERGKFRLPCNKKPASTMQCMGQSSESTGNHAEVGVLDDIIGQNTIDDSLMPKVRAWYEQTVLNVIMPPHEIWMQGTHWEEDDAYADWKKHGDWDIHSRACYEDEDGNPATPGDDPLDPYKDAIPVFLTRDEIEKRRRQMSDYHFSCQMMNSPKTAGSRLWVQSECERFCSLQEAYRGDGRIIVLSDPAPKDVGSHSGIKEAERADGSGDYWSTAVVRIRQKGLRRQAILLDGDHSNKWGRDKGLGVAINFMAHPRYRTDLFYMERYGGLGQDWTQDVIRICDEKGVPRPMLEDSGGHRIMPKFSDSHAAGAKNMRFESLCEWAKRGDFLICESVPDEFLYGDSATTGLLTQARKWRPLRRGRNNLKFDDDGDVTSRLTDSALEKHTLLLLSDNQMEDEDYDDDGYESQSRYCAA